VENTNYGQRKKVCRIFSTPEMLESFIDWIGKNGGFVSKKISVVNLPEDECSRGVVCNEDLPENFVFLKLPASLLLNSSNSLNFQTHIKTKSGFNVSDWAPLAVSIVLEQTDSNSFWKPYLDILPPQIELPCLWPPEDLDFLKSAKIFKAIQRDFSRIERKIALLLKDTTFVGTENIWREYRKACSVISSYSFCDGKIVSMVPFADLLNHRTGLNNARLFFKRDGLVMKTIKSCKRGDQLYNTYGDLGNSELLLQYGFIDSDNPFTQISVSIKELVRAAKLHNLEIRKPKRIARLIKERFFFDLNDHNQFVQISKDLLFFKNDSDFSSFVNSIADAQILRHTPPNSPTNERQALAQRYLIDYCNQINLHRDQIISQVTH
jgi:hypothetical protein